MTNPDVLKHYAVHYKTGQIIPKELVDKLNKASQFNQGYKLTELLEADELDMKWHTLAAGDSLQNSDSFETNVLRKSGFEGLPIPPRYRSTYFSHIWTYDYAAGYYAYTWAEMLDHDAYQWFENHGGMTRENGQRFRDMILSKGNSEDLPKIFRDFYGHDPDIGPLLIFRGIEGYRQ
jgi:peptidyl-dipeptidase Dcp